MKPRLTSQPEFWNERFGKSAYFFGETPNAFLTAQAGRLAPKSNVVVLGAGEGRNAVWTATRGHFVTAVDFAEEGLRKTGVLADRNSVDVRLIQADVRDWQPPDRWDAVIILFLQLLTDERPAFYRLVQRLLEPGGWLIAQWLRPEQVTEGYPSGGPTSLDRLVPAAELRTHFPEEGIVLWREAVEQLSDGPLQGAAAVTQFVWQKPPGSGKGRSKSG